MEDGERLPIERPIDTALQWYERQPWLRALTQAVPWAGGSIDTMLAARGTKLNQQRIEELFKNISDRLSMLTAASLDHEFLQSEEFFELFRTCATTAAHTTSKIKREYVADFLAGTIKRGQVTDLSQQIAMDLETLQELHLNLLAGMSEHANAQLSVDLPRWDGDAITEKGLADLERLGFLRFVEATGRGPFGRPVGHFETTGYLQQFKEALKT